MTSSNLSRFIFCLPQKSELLDRSSRERDLFTVLWTSVTRPSGNPENAAVCFQPFQSSKVSNLAWDPKLGSQILNFPPYTVLAPAHNSFRLIFKMSSPYERSWSRCSHDKASLSLFALLFSLFHSTVSEVQVLNFKTRTLRVQRLDCRSTNRRAGDLCTSKFAELHWNRFFFLTKLPKLKCIIESKVWIRLTGLSIRPPTRILSDYRLQNQLFF